MVSHDGRPLADQLYGFSPPIASTAPEKADPAVAAKEDCRTRSTGSATVNCTLAVVMSPMASVTVAVKGTFP